MDTTDLPICPYLGSRDSRNAQAPAIEYPSFENNCFATAGQDSPLLTHQATFCVGGNHGLCPRYQALHGGDRPPQAGMGGRPVALGSGWGDLAVASPLGRGDEPASPGQAVRWILFSMALVFLLVTGGVAATFAGWQLVSRGMVDLPGQLQAAAPAGADGSSLAPLGAGPVVLIVTATNTPGSPAGLRVDPDATPTFIFPVAVTATPSPEQPGSQGDNTVPDVIGGPVLVSTPTPEGGGAVFSTPTRRATPTFSVPTSTPTPGQTSTPTRPLATPVVEFSVANQSLPAGACTIASWRVENVRAVFFGDTGVDGQGERRVCILDEPLTVVLSVLLLDGSEQIYPLTVDLIVPTATPRPTATFTPVLTPTPTWTPEGTRTATPVPARYEVALAVEGGSVRTCQPGAVCTVNLSVINQGNLADELFVVAVQGGSWPMQLCRLDNTCSGSTISVGVAPGDSLPITMGVTVPDASSGQVMSYSLQAESGNSGRVQKSNVVTVQITVP